MIKPIATTLPLVLLTACASLSNVEANETDKFEPVRSSMEKQVLTASVPNAIGMISQGNVVVFEQAYGEIAEGKNATIDTIVRLDSLTKPVTAAALLILVDEGRISTSDPVSKYLPKFGNIKVGAEGATPSQAITIHNLLTHTGGLAGYSDDVNALWDSNSNLDFANGIAALPLRHNPGAGFQYGNAYEVLPAIVEVVAGMKFEKFVKARILNPLGMNDTSFIVPESKKMRYSSLYTREDEKLVVMSRPDDPETEKFASGGGGLKSTIKDYHKFATMLSNNGRFDDKQILSSKAVNSMTTVHVKKNVDGAWQGDRGWGYGLAINQSADNKNAASVGSFGWNGGLGTLFFVDPQKELIGIIFTQIHFTSPHELREKFETSVYQTIE